MSEEFIKKLVINGKSKSTHQNYIRQIAKLAIYHQKSPLNVDIDELEEYLFFLDLMAVRLGLSEIILNQLKYRSNSKK